jgi:hypothetical protein
MKNKKNKMKMDFQIKILSAGLFFSLGCTQQLPNSFRYLQQDETFSSHQDVNTKIDLLWVVDNSASMDVTQENLRSGFDSFARRYLKPTWDIRVAVITTDTYMAHPAFGDYLARTIPGTLGTAYPHVKAKVIAGTFENPEWDVDLVELDATSPAAGAFTNGLTYNGLSPLWGPDYARLKPGIHDGPIPAFCFEGLSYFFKSVTDCRIRDNQAPMDQGPEKCLHPGTGETRLSQCVNTVQNNTVRSGRAIIETKPLEGQHVTENYIQDLIDDFMINVSVGSAGHGSERGLASVTQLLTDNEPTETAFFRKDSLRGIIFVADEDDQSMVIPQNPESDYHPFRNYACDQASLLELNHENAGIIVSGGGDSGYCCAHEGCRYGIKGTSCPSRTIGDYTYTPSTCPLQENLIPVQEIKETLDAFFLALDGPDAEDPNYFIVSIVAIEAKTIQELQELRSVSDALVGSLKTHAVEGGDRYIALGELVGNGSLAFDIGSDDYAEVLSSIGRAIVEQKSRFELTRLPTGLEDMIVKINHGDGSETIVPSKEYETNGNTLYFVDEDFVLSLSDTDTVSINYQPKRPY